MYNEAVFTIPTNGRRGTVMTLQDPRNRILPWCTRFGLAGRWRLRPASRVLQVPGWNIELNGPLIEKKGLSSDANLLLDDAGLPPAAVFLFARVTNLGNDERKEEVAVSLGWRRWRPKSWA